VKLKLIVPAGVLLLGGLTACSPSTDTPAAAPAANRQAAEQPAEQPADTGKKQEEEPLTGETKKKAEEAALAKYPGTVKKSEHDVENPGLYAVEIEQDSGAGEIEVYLDKKFNVVKTRDESGEKDDD
jgi:uncharacterized membrane protein YkoI